MIMQQAHGSYLLALLAAAFLSFVTQSTTAVVLIAVALVKGGLLKPADTMMVVYGANVGSSFSRMLLTAGLRGSARQVGGFQDLFKIAGTVLFTLLFYIEVYGRVPLVGALAEALAPTIDTRVAVVNLVYNLGMALLVTPFLPLLLHLLERCWPITEAENAAQLQYLYPEALADPDTTLDLMEREQARLVARLPAPLAPLRPGAAAASLDLLEWQQGFNAVLREMEPYAVALTDQDHSHATSERLLNLRGRHQIIEYLGTAVSELAGSLERTPPSAQLLRMVQNFTEALDLLLGLAAEAADASGQTDRRLLSDLCSDRGELMEKVRTTYLRGDTELTPQDKALLFSVTTYFERLVWLLGRLAKLIGQARSYSD
jgi:phosphate:Na+ symporter